MIVGIATMMAIKMTKIPWRVFDCSSKLPLSPSSDVGDFEHPDALLLRLRVDKVTSRPSLFPYLWRGKFTNCDLFKPKTFTNGISTVCQFCQYQTVFTLFILYMKKFQHTDKPRTRELTPHIAENWNWVRNFELINKKVAKTQPNKMADEWRETNHAKFEEERKKQRHPTKEKEHKHLIFRNREFKSVNQVLERKARLLWQQDKDKLIRRRCYLIDLTTASHDSYYSCVDCDEDTLRSFWLFVYVAPVTFFWSWGSRASSCAVGVRTSICRLDRPLKRAS